MNYDFTISGIKNKEVQHLFHLNEAELEERGVSRITVDKKPGYPCRVSLEDANIGEEILALHFTHHNTNTPYRSSGPIFIRHNVSEAKLKKNEIPKMLIHRYLSLRIYDDKGMMIDATSGHGKHLEIEIQKILANQKAKYIQVHNAKPGCYNCQINRIESIKIE